MQTLTSEPALRYEFLKSRIKTPWFLLVALIPFTLYWIGRRFEVDITTAIIPLFPFEADKGFSFYQDFVRLSLNEILWLTFFFLLTWLFFVWPGRSKYIDTFFPVEKENAIAGGIVITFLLVTLGVSYFTLERFPNSSDEYAYLLQAQTLSEGKLFQKAPPLSEIFHHNHIAVKEGIRIGRFPPGWPLILSSAYVLGVPPWTINPLLGALALIVVYFFARKMYGQTVALWSMLALALPAYYIFNAASYFSHISCLLVAIAFVYATHLYIQKKAGRYLVLAGFCLGLMGVIRYYTALLIFLPFFVYFVFHHRWGAVKILLFMAIGGAPWVLFLLWYNFKLTGSPFVPVTVWAYQDEQLGFVKGHTFLKGVEHIVRRTFMFFYWCSPGLLILYFLLLWKKIQTKAALWTHPEDYIFVLLMAGYFFYYQIGGNQYGPRFLLEGFPFLVLFVIRNVVKYKSAFRTALLAAGLLFAMIKFPFITQREAKVIDERQDLYDLVQERKLSKAIVLVSSPTGIIRPMPAGDLTRNPVHFNTDVLYALELPAAMEKLIQYYPDRALFRYVRGADAPHGQLIPMPLHKLAKE